MNRLTERYKDSIADVALVKEYGSSCCEDVCRNNDNDCAKCHINKALEKLAYYEDLEEQGLLLKLPCKVEDTLYTICTCENVSKILDDEPNFATGYYCSYYLYRNCPHTGDNLCEKVAYKKAIFEDEVTAFFF